MTYFDHLDDEAFARSVRFRVTSDNPDAILPSADIELLLSNDYHLDMGTTYDVALTVDDARAEFAFDATAVDDKDAVIEDVKTLIENFNTPPDDLPNDKRDEWQAENVELADVSTATYSDA